MTTATSSPFGTSASNKEGGDWELPPTGLQGEALVAIVDLGTHSSVFKDRQTGVEKNTDARKILLAWELTEEKQRNGQPFVVGENYTNSLGKKANYRIMLEGWLGRSFSDGENFDPIPLLGRLCLINLSEGLTGKGKRFVEIMGIANPMKGQVIAKPTLPVFAWHMTQITCQKDAISVPAWLPRIYGRLVLDDIKASKEWNALPITSAEYAIDNPNGAPIQGHDGPAY